MASTNQNFEQSLEEELAKIDPKILQYLLDQLVVENLPAFRKTVQEVLDEPIPREMEKHKPLLPEPYQPRPRPPPRQRKTRKMRELLREFEPAPRWNTRQAPGGQNELQDLYGDAKREGEETKGRRLIRWTVIRGLDKDLTQNFMEKIRKNVGTSFYMRHIYGYRLRNVEDGTVILLYKNIGSPWLKTLIEAEEWVSAQETKRLDPDNTERPNTKWVFFQC